MLAIGARRTSQNLQYPNLHDYLIDKGKDYNLNRIMKTEQKQEIEVEKCTFKPKLTENTQKLVKVHNVPIFQRLTKESSSPDKCKKLDNIKTDDTGFKYVSPTQPKPKKKSQKHSKRYAEQEPENEDSEYKMEVDEEKVTSHSINPTEFTADTVPQLFIDVHLDDMSIHRLTIYDGDDPKILARKFCIKYGKFLLPPNCVLDLDHSMLSQLIKIINSQMSKLLNTIDENEGENE
jgi:hypothetical protein